MKYQPFLFGTFDGLNVDENPMCLGPNHASRLDNLVYMRGGRDDRSYKGIRKVPLRLTYFALTSAGISRGLCQFFYNPYNPTLSMFIAPSVYSAYTTGRINIRDSGGSVLNANMQDKAGATLEFSPYHFTFAQFLDAFRETSTLYMANGNIFIKWFYNATQAEESRVMQDVGGSAVNLTGTLTFSSSGLEVTGAGTAFTTECPKGTWIRKSSSDEWNEVNYVASNTSLFLRKYPVSNGAGGAGTSQSAPDASLTPRYIHLWKSRLWALNNGNSASSTIASANPGAVASVVFDSSTPAWSSIQVTPYWYGYVQGSTTAESDKFYSVRLFKAGAATGDNKAAGACTTTPTDYSFGGAAEMWGTTWTAAEINAANFGVGVSFGKGAGTDHCDYLSCSTYGFTIPTASTIVGISVKVNASYTDPYGTIRIVNINYPVTIYVYYTDPSNKLSCQVRCSAAFSSATPQAYEDWSGSDTGNIAPSSFELTGVASIGDYIAFFTTDEYVVYRYNSDLLPPIEEVKRWKYPCASYESIKSVGESVVYFTGNEVRVSNFFEDNLISEPIGFELAAKNYQQNASFFTLTAVDNQYPTALYDRDKNQYTLYVNQRTAAASWAASTTVRVGYVYSFNRSQWVGTTNIGNIGHAISALINGNFIPMFLSFNSSANLLYYPFNTTYDQTTAGLYESGEMFGSNPKYKKRVSWVEYWVHRDPDATSLAKFTTFSFNFFADGAKGLSSNTTKNLTSKVIEGNQTKDTCEIEKVRFPVNAECTFFRHQFGDSAWDTNTYAGYTILGGVIAWEELEGN